MTEAERERERERERGCEQERGKRERKERGCEQERERVVYVLRFLNVILISFVLFSSPTSDGSPPFHFGYNK